MTSAHSGDSFQLYSYLYICFQNSKITDVMKKKEHKWKYVGGLMCVEKTDERYAEFKETQKKTSVSPDELWSLDITIANFIYPRLKMFRDAVNGVSTPCCFRNNAEWIAELDKMINAFKLIAEEKLEYTKKEREQVEEGLGSFKKYYHALWW